MNVKRAEFNEKYGLIIELEDGTKKMQIDNGDNICWVDIEEFIQDPKIQGRNFCKDGPLLRHIMDK